jgi:sugar phosphate isomerase/epimerase
VYVACSTLCFGRHSLEKALDIIAELGFNKYDLALHSRGPHLRPAEVAEDVTAAVNRLRYGPGLVPAALFVDIEADDPKTYHAQFKAICRLARLAAAPVITVAAAANGSGLDAEAERLGVLCAFADAEGVQLTVATQMGTLTETPDAAAALCQRVPGLGLTLDPSHWLVGPNQGKCYDHVMPLVRHVWLRDSGKAPHQFQVRVGQGEIEYGRIITQLERCGYDRLLTVDIRDIPDAPFAMEPEVRKLKYLLESLV